MKISRSLKIYILFAMISTCVVTVLSFSTLAANYFIQGLDVSARYSMEQIAEATNTPELLPRQVIDFDISSKWEDTPAIVQQKFKPLANHLTFDKYVERKHWWEPPTNVVFAFRYDHPNDHVIYVTRIVDTMAMSAHRKVHGAPHLVQIMFYALGGIVIFSLILILLMRQVSKPMGRLNQWAESLTPEVLQQPIPDFRYCELNYLANIVSTSLQSVQTTLEREKKFLAHASHELRTPIAVVRSNTELMQKLIEKPNSLDKQRVVLDRILRAGFSMTDLCETLLWLNRGEYRNLPTSNVELSIQLEQISNSLRYLIKAKHVEVNTQFEAGEYPMKSTLVTIVIGNLIRNAYQHTQCGVVDIVQKGQKITITNRETCVQNGDSALGFGLGLELTERIIRHYQWPYDVETFSNGRKVTIEFVTKS